MPGGAESSLLIRNSETRWQASVEQEEDDKLEFVSSPLQIPETRSTVSVSSTLRHGTRALREARAWLEQQMAGTISAAKSQDRKSSSALTTRDRTTNMTKPVTMSARSTNMRRSQNDTSRRPKSARERKLVTSVEDKSSQRQEKHHKSSSRQMPREAHRNIASLDHREKEELMKRVLFQTSKPVELGVNLKSPPSWQKQLSSGLLDTKSSSTISRQPLHTQSVRIFDDYESVSSESTAAPSQNKVTSAEHVPYNDRVFVTSMQSTEVVSKLCKQTLQPLTIKRALVCQSGPEIKISPQPLKLNEKNVCLTQIQAEEPTKTSETQRYVEVEEMAVQTSPTHISPQETLVKDLLEKVALSNSVFEAQAKKISFDMRSELLFKQNETQTSPDVCNSQSVSEVICEKKTLEISTQTSSSPELLTQNIAVQVEFPDTNVVSPPIKEIESIAKSLTEISIAIQTEQISTCDVATEIPITFTEAATETSPEKTLVLDEIGPWGDAGVQETVVIPATNIDITEKETPVVTEIPDFPIVTKDKNKFAILLSSRILSPILEQNSASDNSPLNASPLAVPAVSLSIPDPVEVEEPMPTPDVSPSPSPEKIANNVQGFLPLLTMSIRATKLMESQIVISEHEASSTLSSLADSELSSLDTTVSPSLTMVESSILRSEGELVCQGKTSDPPDDSTASDDSSSATLSSAPCSQTDWSRGSGRSSGLIDRSVGEVGVIPAAQRRRVLYLASRVAPSLLTNSTSSRSDGELSEGQVLPTSSRNKSISQQH